MIEGILQDLRYALRQLGRSPGFTFVAVPTLALGIAGATTMFAFLQAVARHGQPTVPEPERIARLFTTIPPSDARGPVAFAGYRRLGERSRLFETLPPTRTAARSCARRTVKRRSASSRSRPATCRS